MTTYPCSFEVWEERPPKEEAMVLNSTCLMHGVELGLSRSWCTI